MQSLRYTSRLKQQISNFDLEYCCVDGKVTRYCTASQTLTRPNHFLTVTLWCKQIVLFLTESLIASTKIMVLKLLMSEMSVSVVISLERRSQPACCHASSSQPLRSRRQIASCIRQLFLRASNQIKPLSLPLHRTTNLARVSSRTGSFDFRSLTTP